MLDRFANTCPFCKRIAKRDFLFATPLAVVLYDRFPLNPGHCLLVPKRHVASLFEMTELERADLFEMLPGLKDFIEEQFHPAAFNLGMNIGRAAGQTVDHAHLHLIPRFEGDVQDPRGGVRQVIPARARYWEENP